MEVRKREREELHILSENRLNIKEIVKILAGDRLEIIYVESDDGIFQGVISYGDCLRHLNEGKELINRKSVRLTVDTQEKMMNIFDEKRGVWNIPVLDERGGIFYEFVKVGIVGRNYVPDKKQEKVYCSLLEKCGIRNIVFIGCETWGKNFIKYTSLIERGINIILTDNYAEINMDDSIIVDENYIRSLVKRKEGYCVFRSEDIYDFLIVFFEVSWRNRLFRHMEWFADRITLTYRKIAVLDTNSISKDIIAELEKRGKTVIILDKEDVEFDIYTKKYELKKKCDVDVIISSAIDYFYQKIMYRDKEIYNLNFILMGFEDRNSMAGDCDIVNNILPQLIRKGVQVAIFHLKFGYKSRFSVKSISKYNLVKEYKKIFGMEDGRWNISGDYRKGYFEFIGSNSPYYTFLEDGARKTVGNNENAEHNIFLFGKCEAFGWGVRDEDTEASYMQKLVPKQYNVNNYSNYASQIPWKMRIPDYREGDIVLITCEDVDIYKKEGYSVYEISTDFFGDMNLEEVGWQNFIHGNRKVTKRFAEIIYGYLVKNNYLDEEENAD